MIDNIMTAMIAQASATESNNVESLISSSSPYSLAKKAPTRINKTTVERKKDKTNFVLKRNGSFFFGRKQGCEKFVFNLSRSFGVI